MKNTVYETIDDAFRKLDHMSESFQNMKKEIKSISSKTVSSHVKKCSLSIYLLEKSYNRYRAHYENVLNKYKQNEDKLLKGKEKYAGKDTEMSKAFIQEIEQFRVLNNFTLLQSLAPLNDLYKHINMRLISKIGDVSKLYETFKKYATK